MIWKALLLFSSSALAAQQTNVKVAMKMDVWDLIMQAGLTVKFVLLLLIIFTKKMQLTRVGFMDTKFLDSFWRADNMDDIFSDLERFRASAIAQIFKAGYSELQKIAEAKKSGGRGHLSVSGIDNVSRALRKASDSEIAKLEARTGFLATVGSTAPFIGLFGTVWGIMTAFQNIGSVGAASLAVVAPGISEALVTTAVGLAAAIPAVMAYNYFVGKFKKHDLEISNFNADFINIVKRNSIEG